MFSVVKGSVSVTSVSMYPLSCKKFSISSFSGAVGGGVVTFCAGKKSGASTVADLGTK